MQADERRASRCEQLRRIIPLAPSDRRPRLLRLLVWIDLRRYRDNRTAAPRSR